VVLGEATCAVDVFNSQPVGERSAAFGAPARPGAAQALQSAMKY
jgi:hypothetical protein